MKPIHHNRSLLYKISGNGIRNASYLLGTMHMLCAQDLMIPMKVLSAISKCSIFCMEVDLGNADEVIRMQEGQKKKTDITEDLDIEDQKNLEAQLVNQFGMSQEELGDTPIMELIQSMTIDAMNCDEIKVEEVELLQIARMKGLRSAGLETASEQINIAKKVFTGKEILFQLESAGDYKNTFARMVETHHNEDLQQLAELITNPNMMTRRAHKILVVNRNKRWTQRMPKLMKSEKVFFAVGAGHLPGKYGLLSLLGEQGFSVNPVYR